MLLDCVTEPVEFIVRVRMCLCLFHIGVMYTSSVLHGTAVVLYYTHRASEAYQCNLQRACDAICYNLYTHATIVVEWRASCQTREAPDGTEAFYSAGSMP